MNLQKICLIFFIASVAFTMTPGLFLTDAQSWVDSVVVEPENPTEVDEVTLKVYGSFPSACCYFYVSGDYFINGNQITINLYTFYDPAITCLPVISPYSDEFDIGQLMSGEYTVYITEYLNSSIHDYLTHGFSVAPDFDGDGLPDSDDNCPFISNPEQTNSDTDSYGDACDNCWYENNDDQTDSNANCPDPPYSSDPECGDACEEVAPIPTLTEWGLIIFMTIMMGVGVVVLRKRRMV